MLTIKEASNELKLPYLKGNHEHIIQEMTQRALTLEEALIEILTEEVYQRRNRSHQRRIKQARFQQKKYLVDFDDQVFDEEIRTQLRQLKDLSFIKEKENVILIGNPGTGKTHFSTALGIEACMLGYSVLFANAPNLVLQMKEAVTQSQFVRFKQRFERVDLVIIDELGYLSFDSSGAELLFNLLSNRMNHGSIILTTNLTFDRWHECFKDPTLTGALIDRLGFKAHVINMSGESYRVRKTEDWLQRES